MTELIIETRIDNDMVDTYIEQMEDGSFDYPSNEIIVDCTNQVVDGCHRLIAAERCDMIHLLMFRKITWRAYSVIEGMPHSEHKKECVLKSTEAEYKNINIDII